MLRAGIVIADFYPDIAEGLLASCRATLEAHKEQIKMTIFRVPGALEIPLALDGMAKWQREEGEGNDFLIALGCVIRGETYHFEVVAQTAAMGILQVQLKNHLAIGNGILTVENKEQALARLGKGGDAAHAALSLRELHGYEETTKAKQSRK